MSLKPSKFSDQKRLEEKLKLKESKMNTKYNLPPYTLIVSEGTKTEPYYLEGLIDKINAQYAHITKGPHIIVHGTGRNTCGLLRYADCLLVKDAWKHIQSLWLVYDKDDFPNDNFDNTQFSVEGRGDKRFKVAWSNESIELWFLLHFQDYRSNNGRAQYIEKLNEYIDYSKTRKDLYDILAVKGSPRDAKRRARELIKDHLSHGITSPSAMVPATRVYELIEELERYLH